MLMPNKIVKPVDSLFSIAAYILKVLNDKKDLNVDNLHQELNLIYYKEISIEKLLLSLNFLFIIDKVESVNETIKIKLR